ncbi:MAG: chemotaxis protein CheX [Spirochaetales bacterium]|nr:chemotaxis protein CheX [Spirochaetales bacterium]
MTEQELRIFIDVVIDYFVLLSDESARMGVPYIQEGKSQLLDFTGVIGISGARKGGIFVTASSSMLKELASLILESDDVAPDEILDMVGELTNTIAGNVRREFGSSFMISVPIIVEGRPQDLRLQIKPPVFVVPINWRSYQAFLSVGLE